MAWAAKPMPSTMFGLSGAWREDGKHWHAFQQDDDGEQVAVDRWRRLQRQPDAVLHSPDEVAEWIEARIIELGGKRKVRAVADGVWVEIGDADDLAHLFGEHIVVASRGDSIYTDVWHPDKRMELYIEAVSPDVCDQH